MAAASDYLENELIKHLFRTGSFTKPTALHFALFTAAPNDAGGGTECTGGSYARVDLAPGDANWAATSGIDGITSNAAAITFPAPTADWGQATHWAIFDAGSGGNMLIHAVLTTPKTINNGDPAPSFPIGDLVVTFA